MLTGEPVGGPFFNHILLGYGMPAVLLGVLARVVSDTPAAGLLRRRRGQLGRAWRWPISRSKCAPLFQGPVLRGGVMTDAEDYTYSAVWLAFGVALLIAGILLQVAAGAARFGGGGDPHHRARCSCTTSPACRASTARCPSSGSAWC